MKDMADFVVTTMKAANLNLDYSLKSVKLLDDILDKEIKNGKAKNPNSGFAKIQGQIMFGMSAYLADVIIKNTKSTSIEIDENDPEWYRNFKLISVNEWQAYPGQRLVKRVLNGKEDELYAYVVSCCKYFDGPKHESSSVPTFIHEIHVSQSEDKKSWWRKLFF